MDREEPQPVYNEARDRWREKRDRPTLLGVVQGFCWLADLVIIITWSGSYFFNRPFPWWLLPVALGVTFLTYVDGKRIKNALRKSVARVSEPPLPSSFPTPPIVPPQRPTPSAPPTSETFSAKWKRERDERVYLRPWFRLGELTGWFTYYPGGAGEFRHPYPLVALTQGNFGYGWRGIPELEKIWNDYCQKHPDTGTRTITLSFVGHVLAFFVLVIAAAITAGTRSPWPAAGGVAIALASWGLLGILPAQAMIDSMPLQQISATRWRLVSDLVRQLVQAAEDHWLRTTGTSVPDFFRSASGDHRSRLYQKVAINFANKDPLPYLERRSEIKTLYEAPFNPLKELHPREWIAWFITTHMRNVLPLATQPQGKIEELLAYFCEADYVALQVIPDIKITSEETLGQMATRFTARLLGRFKQEAEIPALVDQAFRNSDTTGLAPALLASARELTKEALYAELRERHRYAAT